MANYNRNWRNYNRREYPEWEEYSNHYNEFRGSRNRGNMIYGQDYGFQNPEADERGRVYREEEDDRDFNYNRNRYNRYNDWEDEYEDQRSRYAGRTNYAYGGPDRRGWSGAYDEDYERYPRGKYRRRENERSYNPHDRSWWDRAGDEISSWFGDEDAERRRDMDRRYGAHRGKGPRGYKRSDERILEDINDRLSDDPFLDASNIEISVNNREVILTGIVGDRVSKRRAEDVVESVSGVTHIENRLRVTQNISQEQSVEERSSAEKSRNNKYDEIQV